uniref:PDZ domain-containing protein n=1 Tax=Amphimedon queenslandica TaxID=400682 RepID=A0A1X7T060_AMPQE
MVLLSAKISLKYSGTLPWYCQGHAHQQYRDPTGLGIVGGHGSPTGDVPIYVKRILPESVLQKDSKIKTGDELVAVNDLIIHNVTKDYATEALTNVQGTVRLLLIQDL